MGQISEMDHSRSDQARIPTEMCVIIPPQGTVIYDAKSDRSWGIKYVMHGPIITFKEPHAAQATEGTLLWFNPGEIKAHVTKRNLTGEEINSIGRQCFELDRENHILSYLPTAIEQTEKLRLNLENEGFYDGHGAHADISGIGVTLGILRNSLPGHQEYRDKLAKILYEAGVTLVESETKSTRDGLAPVALIVAKDQLSKTTT